MFVVESLWLMVLAYFVIAAFAAIFYASVRIPEKERRGPFNFLYYLCLFIGLSSFLLGVAGVFVAYGYGVSVGVSAPCENVVSAASQVNSSYYSFSYVNTCASSSLSDLPYTYLVISLWVLAGNIAVATLLMVLWVAKVAFGWWL